MSAEACSPASANPPSRSLRRSAAASASVARQPKFSMENVDIYKKYSKELQDHVWTVGRAGRLTRGWHLGHGVKTRDDSIEIGLSKGWPILRCVADDFDPVVVIPAEDFELEGSSFR